MIKVLALSLLLSTVLFAKSIHFLENKHYASLDKSISKKGLITFKNKKISIQYDDETQYISYDGKYLYSYDGTKVKKTNLDTKPTTKIFFMLFEAIYFNKLNILSSYFTIKQDVSTVSLLPKKNVSKYIKSVAYKKEKGILHFLNIHLTNGDRIHIEEIH